MAASLLGTFTAVESATQTATSGSRTTTAASLTIGHGGAWNTSDDLTLVITDDKSNVYAEHFEQMVTAGAGSFGRQVMSSNNGGTRGASHEVIVTVTNGASGCTVGGLEFDGVDPAATVTVGTAATGTGTAASCSVAPGAAALVVGLMVYDGSGTTFVESDGTVGLEVDENNSFQANGSVYKVGANGSTTIAWTIAASRPWACRAVAWTETAGVGGGSILPLVAKDMAGLVDMRDMRG